MEKSIITKFLNRKVSTKDFLKIIGVGIIGGAILSKSANALGYLRISSGDLINIDNLLYQDVNATILFPDTVATEDDDVALFWVDPLKYPKGITIVKASMRLRNSGSYDADLEEWTDTGVASTATITTLSISSAVQDINTGLTHLVEAGNYVFVDLPTTDVSWVTISFTFKVNV